METLLLVNPAPRKGKGSKMARTAKQRAAIKRLVALNRARRGHKKHSRKAHAYASNPAPRRAHHRRRSAAHSTVRKHHYRRNPSPRLGGIGAMFMPAAQGALGALGVDLVTGYLPLPLAVKVSPARHLIKGVLAIGMGMALRGRLGQHMAQGALTVAMHDAAKEAVQMMAPGVQLGAEPTVADLAGVGYYNPAPAGEQLGYYPGMGGIEDESMERGYSYTT